MIKNIVNGYLEKKQNRLNKRKKMAYMFENGTIKTLDELERKKVSKDAIFDYFKHKNILDNDTNKVFLFITFTLSPRHNHKENSDFIGTIKNQNEIFESFNHRILKHIKNVEYIKVKELTKKKNLHIHTLFKIDKEQAPKLIKTILKQKNDDIGAIDIKSEINSFLDIEKDFKTLYFKGKELLFLKNENQAQEKIKIGDILTLERLENFDKNNIKNYILKYIKKNIETNSNNENKEHIFFKCLDIKKLTTSQAIISKAQKPQFLKYYYFMLTIFKENTKNMDLFKLFIDKYMFNDFLKHLESKKIEKPRVLLLKDRNDLIAYLFYKLSHYQTPTTKSETIFEIIAKIVLNEIDNLENIDINDEIQATTLLNQEKQDQDQETIFEMNENHFTKLSENSFFRSYKLSKRKIKKMNELEYFDFMNSLKSKRKYVRKCLFF